MKVLRECGDEWFHHRRGSRAKAANHHCVAGVEFVLLEGWRIGDENTARSEWPGSSETADPCQVADFRAQPELVCATPINQHRVAKEQILMMILPHLVGLALGQRQNDVITSPQQELSERCDLGSIALFADQVNSRGACVVALNRLRQPRFPEPIENMGLETLERGFQQLEPIARI